MTEAYHDALQERLEQNVWDRLADEATSMSYLEYATTAADVAGIFDPTPVSDTLGLAGSVLQKDWIGAGLSLVSYVPYLGDAFAKTAKIGKLAPRTARALEAWFQGAEKIVSAGGSTLRTAFRLDDIASARRIALERVREAMLDARRGTPGCINCEKLIGTAGQRRTLQMPRNGTNGSWRGGAPDADGNGAFIFDTPRTLPDGRTVSEIEYRGGLPNFDDYIEGGKHQLWEVSGDASTDARALADQMRASNPDWEPPDPSEYVLHHFGEDGTVGYVPRLIHDRAIGGVGHTGGNSMINNELF